jgi:hypothetical protein
VVRALVAAGDEGRPRRELVTGDEGRPRRARAAA